LRLPRGSAAQSPLDFPPRKPHSFVGFRETSSMHAPSAKTRDVLVREARDSDGPALGRLIARCFADYPGCLYEPDEFPELARPASHYREKPGRLVVAESGGAVIGSLAIFACPEPGVFELAKVYVHPDFQGHGVAQDLFAWGLTHAQSAGASELRLWTDTRFIRGHAFYRKLGFLQQAGTRYLHDVSASWEFAFRRQL
jgi:putative acetyltransferase